MKDEASKFQQKQEVETMLYASLGIDILCTFVRYFYPRSIIVVRSSVLVSTHVCFVLFFVFVFLPRTSYTLLGGYLFHAHYNPHQKFNSGIIYFVWDE